MTGAERQGRGPSAAVLALLVLCFAVLFSACGIAPPSSDLKLDGAASRSGGLPITVDSLTGGTTTVTDTSRIVPLNGDVAEIVYALGLGDRVVGVDTSATFPAATGKPRIGYQRTLSTEGILALKPTVVIGTEEAGPPPVLQQLAAAGVPTVKIPRGAGVDDVPARIEAAGKALGASTTARRMAEETKTAIDAAKAKAAATRDRPRVAFLYVRGQSATYQIGGAGSRADAMITAAGAVDAGTASGIRGFKPLTPEALVAANPDVILVLDAGLASVGGVDGLLKLPGVAQTPAGQNRRVVSLDDLELLGLGPRTGTALDKLTTALHGG